MSILPCHHPVPALPGALPRNQIVLPAVHGAADDAPPERLSGLATAARCAVPGPVPPGRARAAHVRRFRAGQRQACRRPAPPSCRLRHPRTPWTARPTSGYCHWLDISGGVGAGYRRSRAAGQPVLLPNPHRSRVIGRNQHGADGRRPGTRPPDPPHAETPHPRRAESAVTTAQGNRELDDVAAGKRAHPSGTGLPGARLPWAARTGSFLSRNWLPTWACRRRPSTAAGGNGAFAGAGWAGTCGSASGTWRNGSRPGRYDRGQNPQAL